MGEEEPLASPYFGHHSFLLALGNKEVDEICSLRKWKSGLVSSPALSYYARGFHHAARRRYLRHLDGLGARLWRDLVHRLLEHRLGGGNQSLAPLIV